MFWWSWASFLIGVFVGGFMLSLGLLGFYALIGAGRDRQ